MAFSVTQNSPTIEENSKSTQCGKMPPEGKETATLKENKTQHFHHIA
jgi:hypothetical protein